VRAPALHVRHELPAHAVAREDRAGHERVGARERQRVVAELTALELDRADVAVRDFDVRHGSSLSCGSPRELSIESSSSTGRGSQRFRGGTSEPALLLKYSDPQIAE